MNTRILFTDLDGTLLDDNKNITSGNQQAIDEALSQGHKIVLSTGRPLASARIQAERLGLTREGCYAITYNGGLIYDLYRQETLFGKTIPKNIVLELFYAASERCLHIHTYTDTHILSCYDTAELHEYSSSTLLPYCIADRSLHELTSEPYKVLAIDYKNMDPLLSYQHDILGKYSDLLDSFFSSDCFLEIVPKNINKGASVKWLCEYLGIPLENSVAAGDAQNDISMLEAAQIGAVMCNAFPGIAEHGNYITSADNNHDGVAEIIRKFIL
ncbi:MAG: Cof-type HAD-IIB family hydrolase [Lachnospiraceae bacterium]|nr:Cof-type HAD-IIB family hydrolase [Lachnospiraceae bacterium]